MPRGEKNIVSLVERAVRAPIEEAGFELWDLEYVKEGSEWFLRITVDRPGGVDIDACEKAFRIVDPIITELDPVENAYHLEVSSPGLERVLRTEKHFRAVIGQVICVRLFTPVGGAKELRGRLTEVSDDGALTLAPMNGGECVRIEKKNVSKAHVWFDFDSVDPDGTPEEEFEEDFECAVTEEEPGAEE